MLDICNHLKSSLRTTVCQGDDTQMQSLDAAMDAAIDAVVSSSGAMGPADMAQFRRPPAVSPSSHDYCTTAGDGKQAMVDGAGVSTQTRGRTSNGLMARYFDQMNKEKEV